MLTSEKGEKIGESKKAAREGIAMVTLSRVLMAAPGTTVLQIALKCTTNIKLYGTYSLLVYMVYILVYIYFQNGYRYLFKYSYVLQLQYFGFYSFYTDPNPV